VAGGAGAVTQQGNVENGGARRVGGQGNRGGAGDLPAGARGACGGLRSEAQQEQRHPRLRRGESQPPGGGEIENSRVSPWLDDHRPERGAARRLEAGTHHRIAILETQQDQPVRVDSHPGKAGGVQMPRLGFGMALAGPDDGPVGSGRLEGQGCGKAGGGGGIGLGRGMNLVQGRTGKRCKKGIVRARFPAVLRKAGVERRLMIDRVCMVEPGEPFAKAFKRVVLLRGHAHCCGLHCKCFAGPVAGAAG